MKICEKNIKQRSKKVYKAVTVGAQNFTFSTFFCMNDMFVLFILNLHMTILLWKKVQHKRNKYCFFVVNLDVNRNPCCLHSFEFHLISAVVQFLPLGSAGQWPASAPLGSAAGFLWWLCSEQPKIDEYSVKEVKVTLQAGVHVNRLGHFDLKLLIFFCFTKKVKAILIFNGVNWIF